MGATEATTPTEIGEEATTTGLPTVITEMTGTEGEMPITAVEATPEATDSTPPTKPNTMTHATTAETVVGCMLFIPVLEGLLTCDVC